MRRLHRPDVIPFSLCSDMASKSLKVQHEWWEADRKFSPKENGKNRPERPDLQAVWNENDVRGYLYAMHGEACAYCQDAIEHWKYEGTVDHFRPKKGIEGVTPKTDHRGYWWLAYDPTNLFLACENCNEDMKGTKFPIREATQRCDFHDCLEPDEDFSETLKCLPLKLNKHPEWLEDRLLINPTVDPVEEWLAIDVDNDLFPIVLTECVKKEPLIKAMLDAVLDTFKLNAKPTINRKRKAVLDELFDASNGKDWQTVKGKAHLHQPHAWTVRQIWRALEPETYDQHCPTPDEDFKALISHFCDQINNALEIEKEQGPQVHLEKPLARYQYALAVIWLDSKDKTQTIVDFLRQSGVYEMVRDKYVKLGGNP